MESVLRLIKSQWSDSPQNNHRRTCQHKFCRLCSLHNCAAQYARQTTSWFRPQRRILRNYFFDITKSKVKPFGSPYATRWKCRNLISVARWFFPKEIKSFPSARSLRSRSHREMMFLSVGELFNCWRLAKRTRDTRKPSNAPFSQPLLLSQTGTFLLSSSEARVAFDIIGMLFRSSPSRDSVKDVDCKVNICVLPIQYYIDILWPIICQSYRRSASVPRTLAVEVAASRPEYRVGPGERRPIATWRAKICCEKRNEKNGP